MSSNLPLLNSNIQTYVASLLGPFQTPEKTSQSLISDISNFLSDNCKFKNGNHGDTLKSLSELLNFKLLNPLRLILYQSFPQEQIKMLDQEFQEHDLFLAILDRDQAYYKKSLQTQCKKLRITPDKLLSKLFFKFESVELLSMLPVEIGRVWCRSEMGKSFELDFDYGKIKYLSESGADDDRAIASFILGKFEKEDDFKGIVSKVIEAWINRDFAGIINSLQSIDKLIENGKIKRGRFNHLLVLLHILSLIKEDELSQARSYLTIYQNFLGPNTMIRSLDICLDYKAANVKRTKKKLKDMVYGLKGDKSEIFFRNLAYFWINDDFSSRELEQLKRLREDAEVSENRFMFYEIDALLKRNLKAEVLGQSDQRFSNIRLCELFDSEASWEELLTSLNKQENPRKLIWMVRLDAGSELQDAWCEIEPALVERKLKNKYGSPKIIGWQELLDNSSIEMSDQDKRVLSLLKRSGEDERIDYKFPETRAVAVLNKAENVFLLDDPSQQVLLENRSPEIDVKTYESSYELSWSFPTSKGHLHLHEIDDFKYEVCSLNESQIILREKLLKTLSLPKNPTELKKFTESLASNIVFKGGEELFGSEDTSQSVNTQIKCRFNPSGVEYKLEIVAQPDWAYEEVPGTGRTFISMKSQGRTYKWFRDLNAERLIVDQILNLIDLEKTSDLTYEIYDRQHLLEILEKLSRFKNIKIEWPKDLKITAHKYSSGILSVNASENKDWFKIDGKLRFGEVVVKLATLLEKINKKSRYVTLSENQYLIIKEELREQLSGISELVDQRDEQLLLHSTLAEQLNSRLNGVPVDLEEDILFKDAITRALRAKSEVIGIPENLKVELRSYQQTGYKWMAKMTSQGIGVCLADDMGLGKTIQTLALLSFRAEEGPSIVIAPTSLCTNWCNEGKRFASGLSFINYSGELRRDYLKNAGAGDVLVLSYGILIQDSDFLSEKVWNVMVLDEAQMVKNTGTLRSKSIRLIQSKYSIALSGTPLENHTGELWNIFDILNPGLLGNRSAFNKNFALPIERGDQQALKKLRSRIKPFLLRRLRKQVLDDLPESQESIFYVNLSEKENDLYNAHRYNAIKNLKKFRKETKTRNKKRIEILAEITRLRIAAANPQIVDTHLDLSNKSEAVISKLRNLNENGHATLIFSQFVNHLDIIQNLLVNEGISFSRLDGSMTAKTRQQSIDSFSEGLVSCMLISLKAGGVGLNLTRADHVIHLDPWWNPAVEDQAIARAVRMGQKNKVNVIRFISKNTIEEDIVKLHDSKRGLADDLLKGTSAASKLSIEELIELIDNN